MHKHALGCTGRRLAFRRCSQAIPRCRVARRCYEQPGQRSHALPIRAVSLTPPFKGMPPRADNFPTKSIQPPCITGYVVVIAIPSKQPTQPLSNYWHRLVPTLVGNCARISLSVALIRLLIVPRSSLSIPFLDRLQKCVNPRKSKVSGFPDP